MLTPQELQLLSALRKNARVSLAKIAKDTNMPKSTVFDKLKRSEKDLIHKHISLIDFKKIGFNSRVFVAIKTTIDGRSKIKQNLISHQNVNNLYIINGGFDFFIEAIFSDTKAMEDFLAELKSNCQVLDLKTHAVIDDIAREKFLSN